MNDKYGYKTLQKLVSIVLPVYNCEKYLPRCIESILAQTYSDFELIIIDDGSEDGSREIEERFMAQDARIYCYFQENQGVSSARNLGMEKAKGDYFTFIDADDYINPKYLEYLVWGIEHHEVSVCFCDYGHETDEASLETIGEDNCYVIDMNDFSFDEKFAKPYVWGSIFRKKLVEDIRFAKNISLGEDTLFLVQALCRVKKIAYVDEKMYYYIVYENSLSHGEKDLRCLKAFEAWEQICTLVEHQSEKFMRSCHDRLAVAGKRVYRELLEQKPEDKILRKRVLQQLRKEKKIFLCAGHRKRAKLDYWFLCWCPCLYDMIYLIRKKINVEG